VASLRRPRRASLLEAPFQQRERQQVLEVEDASTAISQIKRYLTELGVTSVMQPVGEGALNVALRLQPDVIVLNSLLPDCSVWDVLTELKSHPRTRQIPIMFLSVVDERSRSLNLEATEPLLQPLSRQAFTRR